MEENFWRSLTYEDTLNIIKEHFNLVVLTTETPHHCHFVREIGEKFPISLIVNEQRKRTADFSTVCELDKETDAYECERWFKGKTPALKDYADVFTTESVNSPESLKKIKSAGTDVVLAFGVGRIEPGLVQLAPDAVVNVQGTNPEQYRGLDTIYWACYHDDYYNLAASLHQVLETTNSGPVILKHRFLPPRESRLFQLRSNFCEKAIEASMTGLSMFSHFGQLVGQPQLYRGRFYSFMPSSLKQRIKDRFENSIEEYYTKNKTS